MPGGIVKAYFCMCMARIRTMRRRVRNLIIPFVGFIGCLPLLLSCESKSGDPSADEHLIHISNDQLELTIHPYGGALVGLKYGNSKVNPFNWAVPAEEMPPANRKGAPFRGHFICLNRWGSPTPGEMAHGMPYNGEASNLKWTISKLDKNSVSMEVHAPKEAIHAQREVQMSPDQPVILIKERYLNSAGFARPVMLVQHGTFGRPFLDSSCITNSNAAYGFLQSNSRPDPEEHVYMWPGDRMLDIRRSDQDEGFVSSHVVSDSLGWCTLASPSQGFLVGYLWDARTFPWLHIWHGLREEKLWARGIEFGNTGLGDNYSLGERYRLTTLGKTHSTMVDAGEALECSYLLFVAPLPTKFSGVRDITHTEGSLILKFAGMQGESTREIKVQKDFITDYNTR